MKDKINVLVAHFRPDIVSGAEFAIADMIDRRSEHIEYIMLTPGEGALADFYRDKGYTVWADKVQTKRRLYPGLHTLQSFFFAQKLKKNKIDVVVCNTFPATSRVGTACRLAEIPYAIYIREYISDNKTHRKMLNLADRILAVSKDVGQYLNELINPAHIVVAHDNIVSAPILQRIDKHRTKDIRLLPFSNENPVVGVIGRITSYKQQDLFIRAVPYVLARVPDARFVVVGSAQDKEKSYENNIKQLAVDLGIKDKVSFMGHRKDAIEIMTELSAVCLTSDREPFPRTVLEAQLVGCPVIAADTGGCPEMVEDGETGLLFSSTVPDAEKELASCIIRLLEEDKLRTKINKYSRQRLDNTFATLKPVRWLEENFEAILKERFER